MRRVTRRALTYTSYVVISIAVVVSILAFDVTFYLTCSQFNVNSSSVDNVVRPSILYVDDPDESLPQRVRSLNDKLCRVRAGLLDQLATESTPFDWSKRSCRLDVVDAIADDDFLEQLRHHVRSVTTVALRWSGETAAWSSLQDRNGSNVLIRSYYDWTGDERLCHWIDGTATKLTQNYDAIYNRTCRVDLTAAARTPAALRPVSINFKTISRDRYWPNDGRTLPAAFYTDAPTVPTYLHVHRDAVVSELGDVVSGSGSVKLVLDSCSHDVAPTVPRGRGLVAVPTYDELFVVAQHWGASTFHRLVEVLPRVAFYADFLRRNPDVGIVASEGPGGRLGELLSVLGIDERRLVTGVARARVVYQPKATRCGTAGVQEIQTTSKIFRDHVRRAAGTVSSSTLRRNRLVVIRRSGNRRFTEQRSIERAMESVAGQFGLVFDVFDDSPVPPLNVTMMMFQTAVVVVGPHGAGLANIIFSEPGTYVVEGVCDARHLNLCFQHLAYVLGHRWQGIGSTTGACEDFVDVSAERVESAVRQLLMASEWRRRGRGPWYRRRRNRIEINK